MGQEWAVASDTAHAEARFALVHGPAAVDRPCPTDDFGLSPYL